MKFTKEDYNKKIEQLRPVAEDLIATKTPEEGMELVSSMDPVDAYILGRIIGQALQADADMKEFMRAISAVDQMMEKKQMTGRREIPIGRFIFN